MEKKGGPPTRGPRFVSPLSSENTASSSHADDEAPEFDAEHLARLKEEAAKDWERLVPDVLCD